MLLPTLIFHHTFSGGPISYKGMSSCLQIQEEEREVLLSIYDGDPAFKQLSPTSYQYKYGDDGDAKSILLEIKWSENYPLENPVINLDAFYNKHIVQPVKSRIREWILSEAKGHLGTAMTFTLFEAIKEKLEELTDEQPEKLIDPSSEMQDLTIECTEDVASVKKATVKKEQLSKAQKRKQWDRVDNKGEKPRGADWVDIVKHLSQTGSKAPTTSDVLPS